MDPMTDDVAIRENYLAVEGARHQPLTRLYLQRLAHLLDVEPGVIAHLATEEQHLLRTQALLSTVRTLTAMGEGPAASELLRRVARR